jgi:hypothetical protein
MRTKTLILSAALGALSAASLMAQVYSLNEVGYINVTLAPGFNQIANQLSAGGQGVATYLSPTLDAQLGTNSAFVNAYIFKYSQSSGYVSFKVSASSQANYVSSGTTPLVAKSGVQASNVTINPGEGIWFYNPSANPQSLTFVGSVSVTNSTLPGLTNQLASGIQLVSSVVPIAGQIDTVLGIVPQSGDYAFVYEPAGNGYNSYKRNASGAWVEKNAAVAGLPNPVVGVGQAFWYTVAAVSSTNNWVQTYGVGE